MVVLGVAVAVGIDLLGRAGFPGKIKTLNCCATQVANLGPLSACVMLQTLDCFRARVVVLSPLAACTALVAVSCDERVPLAQVQYVQAACGSLVVKQYGYCSSRRDGPRVEHPALHPTA